VCVCVCVCIDAHKDKTKLYVVSGRIPSAKNTKSVRATVYRMAERRHAHHKTEEKWEAYVDDTLTFSCLFKREEDAMDFQTDMNNWRLEFFAVVVNVEEKIKCISFSQSDVRRIFLKDYDGTATTSPCQSLEDFCHAMPSNPPTSAVSMTNELATYQTIEKPECFNHGKPYKLHLKDKTKQTTTHIRFLQTCFV